MGGWGSWEVEKVGDSGSWEVDRIRCLAGRLCLCRSSAIESFDNVGVKKCLFDDIIVYDPDDIMIMRTRDNNERTNGDRYPPHWVNGDGGVACLPPI